MHLKQARHAILPASALAAWGVTAWVDTLHGIDVDRDDRLPAMLAIVLTVWVLIDYYYRRLNRDRRQAHAGHDLDVLSTGVAAGYHVAYTEQQGDGGKRSKSS